MKALQTLNLPQRLASLHCKRPNRPSLWRPNWSFKWPAALGSCMVTPLGSQVFWLNPQFYNYPAKNISSIKTKLFVKKHSTYTQNTVSRTKFSFGTNATGWLPALRLPFRACLRSGSHACSHCGQLSSQACRGNVEMTPHVFINSSKPYPNISPQIGFCKPLPLCTFSSFTKSYIWCVG